jgi:hypothetical protein
MYEARIAAIAAAVRDGDLEYRVHVLRQMRERAIRRADLEWALCEGDSLQIEDYPRGDARGASCLIWCRVPSGRVLHVVVSYPPYPALITAYWPDERPHEWTRDYTRRVR